MTARAPVSVCMICDDDPHLNAAVASIEPYVERVIVTRPRDVPGAHDDEGRMADFSAARNACLSLANAADSPWVMWLDSDDLIAPEHAERLVELTRAPLGHCYLLPYEYAYDAVGRCTVRQYRERLFSPRGAMRWVNPVHEVCVPVAAPLHMVLSDDVVIRHQRQYNTRPAQEPNRNLRILTRWMAEHPDDVRNQFYLGLEYANAGQLDNAVTWLTRYLSHSGWLDEKAQALFRLVQICEQRRQYQKALDWAFEALKVCDWFESCFAITRQFYHLKNWQRCAHYARMALNAPPTQTVLFTDESARGELHVYLNVALNQLGKTQEAYESTLAGLDGNPEHPLLRHNRVEYEKALGLGVAPPTSIHAPPRGLDKGGTSPLDIVFVTASWERWDPESIATSGIGGSETMLANMARHLAKLGHRVTVYADPIREGSHDGAEWRNNERFHDLTCDVLVVSRNAPFLSEQHRVAAGLRLLWCHDVCAIGADAHLLLRADRLLALSQWHKDFLVAHHGVSPEQVLVTRNGIELERFASSPPRNPFKIVNSSSPDRSWPVLLECFARIREREPRAELHLFYGFENWKKCAAGDRLQLESIALLEAQIARAPGVHFHGRVSQERLTQEFLTAGLWAHPTWFTETSCITAMEAQAAGLHIVTSNLAALKETVGAYGVLLDGEWTSVEYQQRFVDACVDALRCPNDPYDVHDARRFALAPLAVEWETMMRAELARKKTHPLNPYYPTSPYRAKPPCDVKLNIGCGPNIFPFAGWTNYDKAPNAEYWAFMRGGPRPQMPEHQRVVAAYAKEHHAQSDVVVAHDWAEPFPHVDSSVDYIYVGQAIEHMNRRTQVEPFLAECRRMLKPGGTLRITTPDLTALIDAVKAGRLSTFASDQPEWFKSAYPADQFCYLAFGASGPECTQSRYEGHFHLYCRESMEILLKDAGFARPMFDPPPMSEVTDQGMSHSFAVEATK